VRTVAVRDRDVERVGPFTATFDPHSTNRYLNYAFPDDDARPTPEDVAALVAAYRQRDRMPRLEFMPAVAPAVEDALAAGGFAVEAHLAVMTCAAADAVDLLSPRGIAIETPITDDDLRGMRIAQHSAFGVEEPDVDEGEVGRQRASMAAGSRMVLARDQSTGLIVGGGVAAVPAGGVTEIAGIGVIASHRTRGIAGAITSALTRASIDAGQTTVWLTPGHDDAQRVYARAGFRDTSMVVHMSMAEK